MDRNSGNTKTAEKARKRRGDVELREEALTGVILTCFYKVYNTLGYGHVEAVYRAALVHELRKRGHHVLVEAALDVWYDGVVVGHHRADIIVENRIVLELKAGPKLDPQAEPQLLNNLRCSDIELGILLYFGPRPYFNRIIHTRNVGRTRSDS